jgi:hypothetical protein
MGKLIIGNRYDMLALVSRFGTNKNGDSLWMCKCDCGQERVCAGNKLRSGRVKNCGCVWKAQLEKWKPLTHLIDTRIYRIWNGIISRCTNQDDPNWHRYGGRGITVCDEWRVFENFYNDMKDGYSDDLSIDRKENNKGYYKENCKWATRVEQARNRRSSRFFEHDGMRLTIAEWCERLGISSGLVRNRLRKGWDEKTALLTPKMIHGHTLKNPLFA